MSSFELLEVTSQKTATIQPLSSHLTNHSVKMSQTCWRRRDAKFTRGLEFMDTAVLADQERWTIGTDGERVRLGDNNTDNDYI